MKGGSLTRYHPPSTRSSSSGGTFSQTLIKMATPLISSTLREGAASLQKDPSWRKAGKAMLAAAKKGVKRKAQSQSETLYKKASKRARDIFGS